jgi:hypothetical protein
VREKVRKLLGYLCEGNDGVEGCMRVEPTSSENDPYVS